MSGRYVVAFLQAFLGIAVFLGICFVMSEGRERISWRFLISGIVLQFLLAALMLYVPFVRGFLLSVNQVVSTLETVAKNSTQFLFGYLAGGKTPFDVADPSANFVLAFQVLPLLLLIGALSSLLTHWGVLPLLIKGFSKLLNKALGVSGPLAFGASATVFLGIVEAPLLVKPYLARMSRSELFAIICAGMATIAGTVMVVYASVLKSVLPDPITHLLVASIVSVPAALVLAHTLIPEASPAGPASHTAEKLNPSSDEVEVELPAYGTSLGAMMAGTQAAVEMIVNIVAVIIVLLSLVQLVNIGLGALYPGLSIQQLMGYLLAPLLWLTGMSWAEAIVGAPFMATKIALNEFVAYLDFSKLDPSAMSERSRTILSYALCGFANFGSAGIVVGGMSSIIPERRDELVALTLKSLVVGNLAALMTGAVVGCFL